MIPPLSATPSAPTITRSTFSIMNLSRQIQLPPWTTRVDNNNKRLSANTSYWIRGCVHSTCAHQRGIDQFSYRMLCAVLISFTKNVFDLQCLLVRTQRELISHPAVTGEKFMWLCTKSALWTPSMVNDYIIIIIYTNLGQWLYILLIQSVHYLKGVQHWSTGNNCASMTILHAVTSWFEYMYYTWSIPNLPPCKYWSSFSAKLDNRIIMKEQYCTTSTYIPCCWIQDDLGRDLGLL